MVAYATAEDVRSAVARDPYKRDSVAALSNEQLDSAIEDAQAEVDGWLRQRYTVPFEEASLPTLVRSLTVDVAAYLATLTYYQETEILDTDPAPRRYMRARALLKDIAEGRVDLDVTDDGGASPAAGGLGQPINPPCAGLLTADVEAWLGPGRGC